MRVGKRCRHCGKYRIWQQEPNGALVAKPELYTVGGHELAGHPCDVTESGWCEPLIESHAERATRELAHSASARSMGRGKKKFR